MHPRTGQQQQNKKKYSAHRYQNPYEAVAEEGKEVLKGISEIPGAFVETATNQMWEQLLGMSTKSHSGKEKQAEVKGDEDKATKLNLEKLNKAYARQDMAEVQRLNEKMQEDAEEKQEHMSRHRSYSTEYQRVIDENEKEKKEKERQELQEEEEKKRKEEEERQQQQAQMADSGAAKQKGGIIGQPRKKASTEQQFETRTGYASK